MKTLLFLLFMTSQAFAACENFYFPTVETSATRKYIVCDTEADLPTSGLNEGDLVYIKDIDKFTAANSGTTYQTPAFDNPLFMQIPWSTTPPAGDCDSATEAGRLYYDSDATSGKRLYACEGVTGWKLQGDGTTAGSEAFPVGAVFISVVSTDPATLLGYGTWSAIGAGKVLVGLDSGDTDFDTAEETGGAKTKTIAQANLPNISTGAGTAHTHTQDAHTHTQNSHNHTQDAHSHIYASQTAATGGVSSYEHGSIDSSSTAAEASISTNTSVATNQAATATNQNATATNQNESTHTHSLGGSGTALNVMNPYLTVYIWKRTL